MDAVFVDECGAQVTGVCKGERAEGPTQHGKNTADDDELGLFASSDFLGGDHESDGQQCHDDEDVASKFGHFFMLVGEFVDFFRQLHGVFGGVTG